MDEISRKFIMSSIAIAIGMLAAFGKYIVPQLGSYLAPVLVLVFLVSFLTFYPIPVNIKLRWLPLGLGAAVVVLAISGGIYRFSDRGAWIIWSLAIVIWVSAYLFARRNARR
jgi:hypothetical protein